MQIRSEMCRGVEEWEIARTHDSCKNADIRNRIEWLILARYLSIRPKNIELCAYRSRTKKVGWKQQKKNDAERTHSHDSSQTKLFPICGICLF